jgi:hypothetical protein
MEKMEGHFEAISTLRIYLREFDQWSGEIKHMFQDLMSTGIKARRVSALSEIFLDGYDSYLMYAGTKAEFLGRPPKKDAIYKTTDNEYFQVFKGAINKDFALSKYSVHPEKWEGGKLLQHDDILKFFKGHTLHDRRYPHKHVNNAVRSDVLSTLVEVGLISKDNLLATTTVSDFANLLFCL